MKNNNRITAENIAAAVKKRGGTCYYVGGYVRDRLMGKDNKDVDIEVHGLTPEALKEVLSQFGEVTSMGASFGIYGIKHCDIDIAMPRSETAVGKGHRDFEVFTDPFLGTEKAAVRRDFTVNALMQDVLTGEVLDYFGGMDDLNKGILRHVNDKTFTEDPLRVLRGAQFAARFRFKVAPETVRLCRQTDITALAKERVMGELQKALLKSDTPSVFFTFLKACDQLKDWFPEINDLIGLVPVALTDAPDVFSHTMLALDKAALLRGQAERPLYFMLSVLCKDLGKITAVSGKNGCDGYERDSVIFAGGLLERLTNETDLLKYVKNTVSLHRLPALLLREKADFKTLNTLFDEALVPGDLLLTAKADGLDDTDNFLEKALSDYRKLMEQPYVKGEDLVKAGIKPGKAYAAALRNAHELRLAGVTKEEALKQTLLFFEKPKEE